MVLDILDTPKPNKTIKKDYLHSFAIFYTGGTLFYYHETVQQIVIIQRIEDEITEAKERCPNITQLISSRPEMETWNFFKHVITSTHSVLLVKNVY